MEIPLKKLKCGFELPVFGFGTWQMGGRETRNPDNDDGADVFAIKNAIDMGITHIDTAAWYSDGHTEELVGQAIKGFDRSKLIITTKVSPMDLQYDDAIKSAHDSLKRLGTDYIDIYLIHNPNPYIDIKESMDAPIKDDEVRKCINTASANSGHILSSSNSINSGVKPDNFVAMVEASRKFGRY